MNVFLKKAIMVNERLKALRDFMSIQKIDAFIIPSTDPHQSEYVADHWKLREYFSGFTGSAGTLIVTKDRAALWTDSRYFLQFEEECNTSEVQLHKQSIPHAPEHVAWLCNLLNTETCIGLDFRLFSISQINYLTSHTTLKNIQLKNQPNFAKNIWINRPSLPNTPIYHHSIKYSGASTLSKIRKIQERLKDKNVDFYFFSSLDEIAWLFNIRSSDVDYTPLVTAYALIGKQDIYFFCDKKRFTPPVINDFDANNVFIKNYDEVITYLSEITYNKKTIVDFSTLNYESFVNLKGTLISEKSYAKTLKSVKNITEIEGSKKCMIKDGVALTKFFIWLEKKLCKNVVSEYEIGQKLNYFRQQQDLYKGESFATIVGYKKNGAIIHYTATKDNCLLVKNENILLLDSGAQYEDGTTDITRTIWLGGTPCKKITTAYTAVLKGYIGLEQLVFPRGTTGVQLDAFARAPLWKNGLDYPHGTGHGIGSFGMVHEPDQGFASTTVTERGTSSHFENQLTTIEPGLYISGEFGIRIENIVLSKIQKTSSFGIFLEFEPLTLCYIDTTLINANLLTIDEKNWLNAYHSKVYQTLSPFLTKEENIWLAKKCTKIN